MASISYRPVLNEVLMTHQNTVKPTVDPTLYPKSTNLVCGIVQVLAGLACAVLGGLLCTSYCAYGTAVYGILAGIFAILAGFLSAAAGVKKTKNLIIAALITTTVTAILSGYTVDRSIVSARKISAFYNEYNSDQQSQETEGHADDTHVGRSDPTVVYCLIKEEEARRMVICSILLLVFSLIAFVVSLWASGIACRFACCCKCCRDCCCTCYANGEKYDGRAMISRPGSERCPQVIVRDIPPEYSAYPAQLAQPPLSGMTSGEQAKVLIDGPK